jgi:hypothetical protein
VSAAATSRSPDSLPSAGSTRRQTSILAIGIAGIFGRNSTSLNGTLTVAAGGPVGHPVRKHERWAWRSAVGDLLPQASLRWNAGVHNFMAYVMGDVPVGAYDPMLANRGVGHGAVDGGVGYTYLNHQTGNEFCLVTGLTYNFKNTNTNYQNGIDWHADWGMSHFLTPQIFAVRWAISMIN